MKDFKIKCLKDNEGVTRGKTYFVRNGSFADDDGDERPIQKHAYTFLDIQHVYGNGFELVKENKMFTKDDIRSGDKIVTEFGKGIVVEFNGKRIIRYADDTDGHDVVDTISPERIKTVIRPSDDFQLRVDKFWDGTTVFDRDMGIGCKMPAPPIKEISVSEAEKALTEKFGQNVRIRVGE